MRWSCAEWDWGEWMLSYSEDSKYTADEAIKMITDCRPDIIVVMSGGMFDDSAALEEITKAIKKYNKDKYCDKYRSATDKETNVVQLDHKLGVLAVFVNTKEPNRYIKIFVERGFKNR